MQDKQAVSGRTHSTRAHCKCSSRGRTKNVVQQSASACHVEGHSVVVLLKQISFYYWFAIYCTTVNNIACLEQLVMKYVISALPSYQDCFPGGNSAHPKTENFTTGTPSFLGRLHIQQANVNNLSLINLLA